MTTPKAITVPVKVDASTAIADLQRVVALLTKARSLFNVKAGYRTTEFWSTAVAPVVLAILTLLFHKDFSGYVQAAAVAAAGISNAVYAISRAHLKRPTNLANLLYDLRQLEPAGAAAVQSGEQVAAVLPKT